MRKSLMMLSLQLSATCKGHAGQTQVVHSMPAGAAALQRLHSRRKISSSVHVALHDKRGVGIERGILAADALTSQRTTQTRSYASQYGDARPTDESFTVPTMTWDSMAANAVSLIGNTGKDVEVKRLETGRVVGNMTLACSHKAGQTTWYEVDIWGPMAERIAEQVPKGSQVCVQGRLSPATWTNREGKLQTKFRISANEVRFVQRQPQPAAAQQQQQNGWGQQQQQQQGWGQVQDSFEQAPPSGSEWGQGNNVVPSQQAEGVAQPLTRESSAEEKWRSVLENPGLWWNNVTTKRNPRAPDFKLKSDPSGMVALWLSSRDTPDWAKEKLESSGISAGYQSSQPSGFSDMN